MKSPLNKIQDWISEEEELGSIFSRGAVLSTVSKLGNPSSRVVGTMFDNNKVPKFFTSPNSRKVDDIKLNKRVSMTYHFSNTLRSISIEGCIVSLDSKELEEDWLLHDEDFRKHYMIFGVISGNKIESMEILEEKKDANNMDYNICPNSFIGYKFDVINRISFYSVKENGFAVNDLYEWDDNINQWIYSLLVP